MEKNKAMGKESQKTKCVLHHAVRAWLSLVLGMQTLTPPLL